MNSIIKQVSAKSRDSIDLGAFYAAVLDSEFAVYVIRFDRDGTARFEDANEIVVGIAGRPLNEIVGQRPIDCLPPEVGQCLETNLRQCAATGEVLTYERSLNGPKGPMAFRTRLLPVADRFGKVGHAVGITRDITREKALVEDAQHKATLLQRLGITLPSAVYLLNIQEHSIRFIGGDPNQIRQSWRSKAEEAGSSAATIKFFHPDDHPKAVEHLRRLAALQEGEVETVEFRILTMEGEYRPHLHRETVFSRTASGEVELILGVSEDVTDLDRAEKQVQDLSERLLTSQLDERRRIAEDLHDSTGQHLFAVGLALARARAIQSGASNRRENRAVLIEALDDARHSLQIAQREVRMLAYLLHPPEIVSEGLSEAIRNFARGFARRSGHYVEVRVAPGADTLDDELSLNLFRACQEALTNIYRHAEASQAVIELEIDQSEVRLEVTDDGVGLDSSQTLGVGLSGMRERMNRLGGDVQLSGGPKGTSLLVTVPRTAF